MPIHTQVWTVGAAPAPLKSAQLASEQLLEDMIVAAPGLLSDDWMVVGRAIAIDWLRRCFVWCPRTFNGAQRHHCVASSKETF